MKELPLLLSGPMVRAVLDRRKTQTRLPLGIQPCSSWIFSGLLDDGRAVFNDVGGNDMRYVKSPFGVPGDLLWVRETHHIDWYPGGLIVNGKPGVVHYRADRDGISQSWKGQWRPSIHMPRWASRLTLRVLRVWVERVQDIDDMGAISEGIFKYHGSCAWTYTWDETIPDQWYGRAVWAFKALWDSIYAAKGLGWNDNPLVRACEFEVVKR